MLKKKVFLQGFIPLYFLLMILLFIMAAAIYVIITICSSSFEEIQFREWIAVAFAVGGFAFCLYTFIRMACNRIIVDKTSIYVPGSLGKNKLQIQTLIPYTDIKNITLISSKKNSLGQTIPWVYVDMPYIVFDCKNGDKKLINVYYYSKKQVIKIIDETLYRAKMLGNELDTCPGKEMLYNFLNSTKK